MMDGDRMKNGFAMAGILLLLMLSAGCTSSGSTGSGRSILAYGWEGLAGVALGAVYAV